MSLWSFGLFLLKKKITLGTDICKKTALVRYYGMLITMLKNSPMKILLVFMQRPYWYQKACVNFVESPMYKDANIYREGIVLLDWGVKFSRSETGKGWIRTAPKITDVYRPGMPYHGGAHKGFSRELSDSQMSRWTHIRFGADIPFHT